jgi:hypothetical protein
MACQVASATASLRKVLKASPLCLQRTLDLKISVGVGGDAYVLQQSSKPVSENWSFSPEGLYLIRIPVHLLVLGVAWWRVLFIGLIFYVLVLRLLLLLSRRSPEPLGPQGPPALSQKSPPPVMHLEVQRVVPPEVVAQVEEPADQRADSRCSCMRYGECEPYII